jgi:hypothetical protein
VIKIICADSFMMSAQITSNDTSKMLNLLSDKTVIIKTRAQVDDKTSCDLYELLEVAGIDRIAFGLYRRSTAGKGFLMSGVEITTDKNPRITVLNTTLKVNI